MKVTVNIEKRYAYAIIGLLVLVAGIFIVNAFGGSQPSVMGHSWGEVECNDCITGGNIDTDAVGVDEIATNAVGPDELGDRIAGFGGGFLSGSGGVWIYENFYDLGGDGAYTYIFIPEGATTMRMVCEVRYGIVRFSIGGIESSYSVSVVGSTWDWRDTMTADVSSLANSWQTVKLQGTANIAGHPEARKCYFLLE